MSRIAGAGFAQRCNDRVLLGVGHLVIQGQNDHAILRAFAFRQPGAPLRSAFALARAATTVPRLALVSRFPVGAHNAATRGNARVEHYLHDASLIAAVWQAHAETLEVTPSPFALDGRRKSRNVCEFAKISVCSFP